VQRFAWNPTLLSFTQYTGSPTRNELPTSPRAGKRPRLNVQPLLSSLSNNI
jgi:hypothetical protein